MNKKSKIIPFTILTMFLVVGSGVLSSCSTPSTSITPPTTTTTTTTTIPTIEVSSVTLNITEVSLEEEATKQLTATVLPVGATDKTVTWTSSDGSVASVSESGLLTAKKAGTATITAKAGKKTATCAVNVTAKIIPVASITLNPTSVSIEELLTKQLTATVLPVDATDKTVFWTSSAVAIAMVDQTGLVTAKKVGTATITASVGDKIATCAVNVTATPVPVTSIEVTPAAVSIEEKKQQLLTATILPIDATDKNIKWTTNASTVATVDATGLVTAVGVGNAIITATIGNFSDTCVVTVTAAPILVNSIEVTPAPATIIVERKQQLTVSILPTDATDKNIKWTTNASTIATVDETGLVTAVAAGEAIITATAGNVSDTCVVTVKNFVPVTSIKFDTYNDYLAQKGTKIFPLTILPVDATDKIVTWFSSDKTIATVTQDGVVTAIKVGIANIVATVGNCSATLELHVILPTVTFIDVKNDKLFPLNDPMIVTVDVTTSNGITTSYPNVNLKTGENKPENATISGFSSTTDGQRSGIITLKEKSTTIPYVVYNAVDSEEAFRALVESETDSKSIVIGLTKDIVTAHRYNVHRPFVLYGITGNADTNITISNSVDAYIFKFDGTWSGSKSLINSTIEFHNITMELNPLNEPNMVANDFFGCGAINVIYDRTILKAVDYNAIYINEKNDGAHFIIKNKSSITGWRALAIGSSNVTIDIEYSTLTGINKYSGVGNNSATIIVRESTNEFKVENVVINCKRSNIVSETNGSSYQVCIDLRNETAKVNFDGENFVSVVKNFATNKTPCYFIGFTEAQFPPTLRIKTNDKVILKFFMTRADVIATLPTA